MPEFLDSTGKILFLGRELGRGGEGAVYEVLDKPELVAKVYHEPVTEEKAEKLRQMCALQNEKLLKLAAWVVETLHTPPHGKVAGFLMPKVNSGTAIHELYNPKSRRRHFPEADWRFLTRAAGNLARAFSVVHTHGHAIGDVNHGNVVIARDATVRLIDCDSYHLNAPEQSFLCEVGVSTHTPPELQGKSLREIERTANHDNFGLAVLIFQLLFMGRHPFSGTYLGAGENTLENSIKEHRFAYGDDAEKRLMRQPPATLPLSVVTARVANLFERAFLTVENRPSAREWIEALGELEENLRDCSVNSSHYYLSSLKKCPWCALEGQTGVLFFPPRFTGELGTNGEFDLVTIGRLIDAIRPPELERNLPATTQNFLTGTLGLLPPSPKLEQALTNYNWNLVFYLVGVGLSLFCLGLFMNFSFIVLLGWAIYSVCAAVIDNLLKKPREDAQLALDEAQFRWSEFKEDWQKIATAAPFENAREELKLLVQDYRELPKLREQKIKELESKRREKKLEIYLSTHSIETAGIVGIDKERLTRLQSNGIRTAADLIKKNFASMSDFSYMHKRKLFDWRDTLAKNFTYKPSAKELTEDFEELEKELKANKLQLETNIKEGFPRLQQVSAQLTRKYHELTALSESLAARLTQAESDLKRVTDLKSRAVGLTIAVVAASFVAGVSVGQFNFREETLRRERGLRGEAVERIAPVPFAPYQEKATDEPVENPAEWGEAGKLYQSGNTYFAEKRYIEALEVYRRAAKLNPNIAPIHRNMGNTLFELSRFQEAAIEYEKATKIKHDDSETWHKLGITYNKLKRSNDAELAFRWANTHNLYAAESQYELGLLLKKAGKYEEAKDTFEVAVSNDSSFVNAHYELGLCYAKLRNIYSAMEQYKILKANGTPLAEKLKFEINKAGLKPNPSDETRTVTADTGYEEAPAAPLTVK
jgi:DNA-binding helix-hairpin-helix protein with protein kinase domain